MHFLIACRAHFVEYCSSSRIRQNSEFCSQFSDVGRIQLLGKSLHIRKGSPMRNFLFTLSFVLLTILSTLNGSRADAPRVQLARVGKATMPIVVGKGASEELKRTAEQLRYYLSRISAAEFAMETGDGSGGIVLGKLADFGESRSLPFSPKFESGPLHREDYVMRSTKDGLYLLGATDLAVSHAVWDLLYRLGYRQYFPGETWEVVPETKDLAIAIDVSESPDFHARRIWYNWGLWGYNNEAYQQWCDRNRVVRGFLLQSGHAYDSIIAVHRKEFDAHPEYLAQIAGKREYRGGDTKFCISNTGLRKLVVAHAVAQIERKPDVDSISMDPSDGGGWCECQACQKIGSVSTRVVLLANEVASAINKLDHGPKYVGMYAYNQHSAPPEIKVHPNVIPSATTAFLTGGLSFNDVVESWQAQGATMGCYDYLSVIAWDWNLPRGAKGARPHDVAGFLAKIHTQGIRYYDAESGDCWGPCGLGYFVAGRVLWDTEEAKRTKELIEDFITKAFGPAKVPMRKFYELINEDRERRGPADVIGRMYRHLDAARKLTDDPKILRRIDDLTLYTRYAEIYTAHAAGKLPKEEVAKFAYRIRKTMMVHSYGIWARTVGQKAAGTKDHPLKDDRPITTAELAEMRKNGISNNQPVEPGFISVAFSRNLVPAARRLSLAEVPQGSFPTVPQDRQQYYLWIEEAGNLDVEVRVKPRWKNRLPEARLYSPQNVKVEPVAVDDQYEADGKTYNLQLKTSHSGLHRLETIDGGDYTYLNWPEKMPITIESGVDTPRVKSHFRGEWSLYFYVPKGTKSVGGWASRIANWAPRISGQLLDADGKVLIDFAKQDEGWFNVPVAKGQDGRLWKFNRSQGERLLMTVPPYLARNQEELLLPEEVVKADED
jgi:hypothetical protein